MSHCSRLAKCGNCRRGQANAIITHLLHASAVSRGDPPHSIGPGTLLPILCVAQAPLTQSHLQATVMQLPNHTWRGMHACSKKQLRSVNLNASHTACTQKHHTSYNCLSNASLQLTWLQQQHQRKNTQHWHAARSYPVNPTPPSTHQPQASLQCSVHSWHACCCCREKLRLAAPHAATAPGQSTPCQSVRLVCGLS